MRRHYIIGGRVITVDIINQNREDGDKPHPLKTFIHNGNNNQRNKTDR